MVPLVVPTRGYRSERLTLGARIPEGCTVRAPHLEWPVQHHPPHLSHTRMPPLEGPFTGQPLPIAATIAKLERPRGRHNVTASLKPAYPVAWS
jgi:hypothetical protein